MKRLFAFLLLAAVAVPAAAATEETPDAAAFRVMDEFLVAFKVQSSPQKVHVTLFSRHRADGSVFESFQSLYVIENVDGRWGVRARSSFAP